eukprot:442629_1
MSTVNPLKCWGRNHEGQLGYGDTNNRGDGPGEMGNALLEVDLGTGFNVTDIVAGGYHTCAVSTLNKIKCWGLGTGFNVTDIVAGGFQICALSTLNKIKCWGMNHEGQLGYGDTNNRGDGGGEMGNAL